MAEVETASLEYQLNRIDTLMQTREFFKAIEDANLPFFQKVRIRARLRIPGIRKASAASVLERLVELKGAESEADMAAIGDGELIRLIIENLPTIIDAILRLIGALS